mgnify:CR=1 FL=1
MTPAKFSKYGSRYEYNFLSYALISGVKDILDLLFLTKEFELKEILLNLLKMLGYIPNKTLLLKSRSDIVSL